MISPFSPCKRTTIIMTVLGDTGRDKVWIKVKESYSINIKKIHRGSVLPNHKTFQSILKDAVSLE
jgi:hypothetical protein